MQDYIKRYLENANLNWVYKDGRRLQNTMKLSEPVWDVRIANDICNIKVWRDFNKKKIVGDEYLLQLVNTVCTDVEIIRTKLTVSNKISIDRFDIDLDVRAVMNPHIWREIFLGKCGLECNMNPAPPVKVPNKFIRNLDLVPSKSAVVCYNTNDNMNTLEYADGTKLKVSHYEGYKTNKYAVTIPMETLNVIMF